MKPQEVVDVMRKVKLLRDEIEEVLEEFVLGLEDELADMIE